MQLGLEFASDKENTEHFAGNYMYMHSKNDGSHAFKHIATRQYVVTTPYN